MICKLKREQERERETACMEERKIVYMEERQWVYIEEREWDRMQTNSFIKNWYKVTHTCNLTFKLDGKNKNKKDLRR